MPLLRGPSLRVGPDAAAGDNVGAEARASPEIGHGGWGGHELAMIGVDWVACGEREVLRREGELR